MGKENPKVRVALIGAGGMANAFHYPSLKKMEDVELAAVCDLDTRKLSATADRFGIEKRYTDYRKMIDEIKPDAAYALMPPQHLYDVAFFCINSGLDLFVEKPPAVTLFQAERLADKAGERGVVTMVGFQRRYVPILVEARRRVMERGPMLQCVAKFYKNMIGAGPYYDGAMDILTSDAIHSADMLRFLGGEVKRIASSVRSLYARYTNSYNAMVEFESGAVGFLMTNWVVGARLYAVEMHGKGISAYVDPDTRAEIVTDNKEARETLVNHEFAGASKEEPWMYLGFYHENREFIECVKEKRQPHNNIQDSVKTMSLVDMIYHRLLG